MSGESGYHNRGIAISAKISSLLRCLGPATYDSVSPKIEFWIKYALAKQSVDPDDLAKRLSSMAWDSSSFESNAAIARFFSEFRDAPHCPEQARFFIDGLCSRVLRWFAAAAAENLIPWNGYPAGKVANWGGGGFVNAASFVGHLVEGGVLDHELVREHLIEPLIAHHYAENDGGNHKYFRAAAIYQLFAAAGNTLLRGLLEPKDVQVCFEMLSSEIPFGRVTGLDAGKLQVRCATRSIPSHRNLTCLVRNSAKSTPHGWSGGRRKDSGKPRRFKNPREKEARMRRQPKSLQRLKLPSHSLPKISPSRSTSTSLLRSGMASRIPSPFVMWYPPLTHLPTTGSPQHPPQR